MALPQYADHLLPRNSTALERVLSAAGTRMTALPVDIDLLKRPFDTPPQFLPHLAFELSTDIWENNWTDTRKRAVTAASLVLQMKKGTAYCLREYARYVDAEVTKIEHPPMRVFSGKALTKAEREAWLATLPQVRVWRTRDSAIASPRKAFLGGRRTILRQHNARFCLNWSTPVPSNALSRLGRRARWVVNGVETDTRVTNAGSFFYLHLPTTAGLRVFSGRVNVKRYYIPSDAAKRLMAIAPKQALPWRSPITSSSLQAINSEPERIRVDGTRGYSVFCDVPAGKFFVPTSAPMRVFERYPVYDGSTPARRAVVQFMGVGRYGFPPHTAWVSLSIRSKRNPYQAGEGIIGERKRFWIPHNPEPMRRARSGVAASKRLSDRIMLRTGPVPPFVAGGTPVLADINRVIVSRP